MPDTQDSAAGLTEALRESLGPVRQHLATVEAEIEVREAELAELRAVRTLALKIVRAADPDAPRPGPKKQAARMADGRPSYLSISDAKIAEVEAWLRDHFTTDDDITAHDLRERGGYNQSTATRAVRALHDRGTLRLDRQGGLGKASHTKFYRLTGGDQNGRP